LKAGLKAGANGVAKHDGKNGYCTHIGNEWFAWFKSTESKSRINFPELLCAGRSEYALCAEAFEYMTAQKLPNGKLKKLTAKDGRVFRDKTSWEKFLAQQRITEERHVCIATEGALLGAVLRHEINPDLVIVSDDAGQFNVLLHALCWIHAERIVYWRSLWASTPRSEKSCGRFEQRCGSCIVT
jgi:hypothetical protein